MTEQKIARVSTYAAASATPLHHTITNNLGIYFFCTRSFTLPIIGQLTDQDKVYVR